MDRKEFIKSCGMLCAGGIGIATFLSACKPLYNAPNTINGNRITIKKSDLIGHKYTLLKNENLPAPIYLACLNDNRYTASLMYCTHKGCELTPTPGLLICPCHGSEFSTNGKVLSGPAEQDLKQYKVNTTDEYIFIEIN